jgi:hypothetical protein
MLYYILLAHLSLTRAVQVLVLATATQAAASAASAAGLRRAHDRVML